MFRDDAREIGAIKFKKVEVRNMRWFWFLCLTIAAVSDIKERMVSYRILAVCGFFGMVYGMVTGMICHIQGLALGLGFLLLSRITHGAIGIGDGWFLTVSAWYLDAQEVWTLLLGGLLISWCWSVGLILCGVCRRKQVYRAALPFLACMWPAGVWILLESGGMA